MRRQGALNNSGHFDTHAMPHLHHQGHPASRADASKTHQREGRAASSVAWQQLWEHLAAGKHHPRESETWSGEHLRCAGVT